MASVAVVDRRRREMGHAAALAAAAEKTQIPWRLVSFGHIKSAMYKNLATDVDVQRIKTDNKAACRTVAKECGGRRRHATLIRGTAATHAQ